MERRYTLVIDCNEANIGTYKRLMEIAQEFIAQDHVDRACIDPDEDWYAESKETL